MRCVEQAKPITIGAGKRAFAITKEFAFQKGFRKGGAILYHERVGATRSVFVNGTRHYLLACPCLARQQYRASTVENLAQKMGGSIQGSATPYKSKALCR